MRGVIDFEWQRHARELRDTWQGRVLLAAEGRLGAVVLSVLSHNFDDAMLPLLRICYPGFTSIVAPFLCSAGKVMKNGNVAADVVTSDGRILKFVKLFDGERQMRGAFRRLADKLKLADTDRAELFQAVRNWVVCDYRIDPTMAPSDPDAKRLVEWGQRLANPVRMH